MWGRKSELRKKLEGFADNCAYDNIIQACGYHRVPEFFEVLSFIQEDAFDKITSEVAQDKTGIAEAMIMPKISVYTDDLSKMDKRLKQGFFVAGVEKRAHERGLGELEKNLRVNDLTDPDVLKKMAHAQSADLVDRGYNCVAYSLQAIIQGNGVRDNYIERETKRLDQLISATQEEAFEIVEENVKQAKKGSEDKELFRLSADDHIKAIANERKRLAVPYKLAKRKLGRKFDESLGSVLQLVRQGFIGKAYLLLSSGMGYDCAQYIKAGREEVLKTRTPAWLFTEMLKGVNFEDEKKSDAMLWYRDQNNTAILTEEKYGTKYCSRIYGKDKKGACDDAMKRIIVSDMSFRRSMSSETQNLIDEAERRSSE